ncbi:uncharacterized protein LOC128203033 [Mya arenaria]|uniref:uncharacterized protein LOC128203033 n=1 Tax=Mya arenaria TaxID=6604 RepID=UPI0022E6FA31|nr:uncharacterized protein LOC128203033 [Mya arenaria]XP_052760238.1 uncharacterized protein LOC128203033 [Mya arenaria]XP_052760239.1 uncharacterized protein LOC128203033 [Mya arenaria]XP_052760240.1 uncharacterized protein LOC128203033 [Mya arenaria]XP_052760241.1 uncharacterized protein LOC128203033 [Mya arenaria]
MYMFSQRHLLSEVQGCWRAYGSVRKGFTDIQTFPLVSYAAFAQFLGVESDLTASVDKSILTDDIQALWCEVNIEFTGLNSTQAMDLWKREAEAVLNLIVAGVHLVPLKLSGEKTVHIFIKLPVTAVEGPFFTNPLFDENGDKMKVRCKTVLQINQPCI